MLSNPDARAAAEGGLDRSSCRRLLVSTFRRTAAAALICLSVVGLGAASSDVADAAKAKDAAAVKALLKNGADVNAAQGDGMTALHWAATNGDTGLVQMLLSAGANVRATTRLGGITPLHMASQA